MDIVKIESENIHERSTSNSYYILIEANWASLVAQMVKNLPVVQETWVQFLGWEDPLEEGMAAHSSSLAWRIPVDRGAWQATVLGSQRVRHD